MAAGCKNPDAKNYNPLANPDNFSCKYALKNQGTCHLFSDVSPTDDGNRSFTMSYSVAGQSWVFFHDYFPDMYLHTREKLYVAKDTALMLTNAGAPGKYLNQAVIKPFFIDVIFPAAGEIILETVNWMTEFLDATTGVDDYFANLTHISIWDSHQHTGKISLADVPPTMIQDVRKTGGQWSFDKFRDILTVKGPQFLFTIFADYRLDSTKADTLKAWYDKELLTDKWFCVRFEFDNVGGRTMVLKDTTVQALKSDR